MTDVERRSDPERGLELMWRGLEPAARGPRHKLSLDQLAEAGVRLADGEGLDAVSIRRVAAALGVGPMSLYTYVPSKVELLELMINRVFGELTPVDPVLPWREQVRLLSDQRWRLYHRHPWVLQSNLSRIPLAPHVLDASEALYAALAPTTLAPFEIVQTVGVLESFLQGGARLAVMEAQEAASTGVSYEAFWESLNVFWEKYFDVQRYPEHFRLWESGGFDQLAEGYAYGLDLVLDGIESLIARRSAAGPAGRP